MHSCLKNVILLSEIHSQGYNTRKKFIGTSDFTDPLFQIFNWHDLFSEVEKFKIKSLNYGFEKKFDLIIEKAEENKKKLIIRDWCFLDFLGKPFIDPTYKNSLLETLEKKYKILNFFIIRHPLENWLSFRILAFAVKNYNFDHVKSFSMPILSFLSGLKASDNLFVHKDI